MYDADSHGSFVFESDEIICMWIIFILSHKNVSE